MTDLNDHLFAQLERLNDENITAEQMELEIKKANAIASVSTQIINNAKLVLEATKSASRGDIQKHNLPIQLMQ